MKEIIYLDTDLMNSMLAQLDEGLVNSFSLEQSTQQSEGETTQSDRGKNAGLSAGLKVDSGALPGGSLHLTGSFGASGNESENYARSFLEGQRDILNKAFHDHALEVLKTKLEQNKLIVYSEKLKEGSIFLGESDYRFYDFELLKKTMDADAFEKFVLFDVKQMGMKYEEAKRIVKKKNPSARERELKPGAEIIYKAYEESKPIVEIFKTMNSFSTYASSLLEDLTVIKMNDKIGLMKKKYLRESVESLSFRTDTTRKLKYLVRVIGVKGKVYDGENLGGSDDMDIDQFPNMMLDILLGSFDILQEGDLLVTPIACYYE